MARTITRKRLTRFDRSACKTRSNRVASAMSVWGCTLLVMAGPARATVGPPVTLTMPADSPMAAAGQAYKGAWDVRVGKAGVIDDFALEGEGWTVQALDRSLEDTAVNEGVHRISFTAVPTNPNAPLRFALRLDGRPASRQLRLGPETFARRGASRPAFQAVPGAAGGARQLEGGAITLRFSGRIVYTRPSAVNPDDSPIWFDTTDEGVDGILVEVMDSDGLVDDLNVDEVIWSGYTDKDGYFSAENVPWDDCDIVGCDDPDIYLRWECDTPVVNVQDAEDVLEPEFSWNTINSLLLENFTGSEVDFGTWKPADLDQMAPLHLHNSIVRAHRFLMDEQQIGVVLSGLPEVDVLWPDGDNAFYNSDLEEIHISRRREWNEGTHTHEYGHHLLENAAINVDPDYCNGFCDNDPTFPEFDCGHCTWCPETDHDAWNEGFPNWLADVVTRDFPLTYTFSDGSPYEALIPRIEEDLGVCSQDGQTHPPFITEGYIGRLLRDIEDSVAFNGTSLQDDHNGDGFGDCLELGYREIFTIALIDDQTTPAGFIATFLSRYPQHMPGFYSTAYNVHPDFVSQFPADTEPPGVVPYATSPSHPPIVGSTLPCIELHLGPVADDVTGACAFSVVWTYNPDGEEPDFEEDVNASCYFVSPARALGDHYVSLRAKDCAGHWSNEWTTFGPFRVTECNGNGILDICEIPCVDVCPCDEPDVCDNSCDASLLADDPQRKVRLKCRPPPDFCPTLYFGGLCGQGQDCNCNLVPDDCDIAGGASKDCNLNGVPDECEGMANWGVDASGTWNEPSNWEQPSQCPPLPSACPLGPCPGIPPISGPVCINVPSDITVTHAGGGPIFLDSLSCYENLTLSTPSFPFIDINLLGQSFVEGDLTVGGSPGNILRPQATLNIAGRLNLNAGRFSFGGTGAIFANGGMDINSWITVASKPLYLANNSTSTGGPGATLTLNNGAALNVEPGSTFEGDFFRFDGDVAGGTLNNEGTIVRSSGTGTAELQVKVINSGEIRAQTGTLLLSRGSTSAGEYVAEPGTVLQFGQGGHNFLPSSSIVAEDLRFVGSGVGGPLDSFIKGTYNVSNRTTVAGGYSVYFNPGANIIDFGDHFAVTGSGSRAHFDAVTGGTIQFESISLSSGFLYFNSGDPIVTETFDINGGQIEGVSTITVNGLMTWTGGGALRNGGICNANGGLLIDSHTSNRRIGNYVINNAGPATFQGSVLCETGGDFNNLAGGTIDIQTDGTKIHYEFGGPFDNAGTVVKTAGDGTSTIQVDCNNTGTVEVQTGELSFSRTYVQTAGETFLNGGNLRMGLGTFPLQIRGGSLRGAGTVTANVETAICSPGPCSAEIIPGTSIGTIHVAGDYSHGAGGALRIELGGLVAGSEHDQLVVSGTANLQGGTVDVVPFGGFIPQVSQAFVILTAGSVQGTFSGVTGLGSYTLTHNPTNVTLTVTQVPCAQLVGPDFDFDCDVDADDVLAFIQCATRSGVAVAPGCEAMDLDGDQDADLSDFGIVQRCYSGEGVAAEPACDD